MNTDPTTVLASQAATATGSGSTSKTDNTTLNKDDFLKLLVAQMQYQDPMSPQDPTQSMQQETLFTIAEQEMNTSQAVEQMHYDSNVASASSMIGKTVSYMTADGVTHNSVVDHVEADSKNGVRMALKDGEVIGFTDITSVIDTPATTATGTSSTGTTGTSTGASGS